VRRYRHHKYTWSKPLDNTSHEWSLVCSKGAVQFRVSFYKENPTCGLEFHSIAPPNGDEAPHHLDCHLTGGRCWHDGTSLYARDAAIWPQVEHYLRQGDHEEIFRVLEREADRQFYRVDERESAR